jgi:hypothetical protein
MVRQDPPAEVAAIRREIKHFYDLKDDEGRKVGQAKFGIYAFYDYDGEPIYVGQTAESISTRIGRHLTGQRSDPVAKSVLDPFEVLTVEAWPLWDLQGADGKDREVKNYVNVAEFTVFRQALEASSFNAVLNEGAIPEFGVVDLPPSHVHRIIPDDLYELRGHADVRIARRAQTIASLARSISERSPSKGLRITLQTQARRLENLSTRRLDDFSDEPLELDSESEGGGD